MKCDTLSHFDKGVPVRKPKRAFNTLDEAIEVAKKQNLDPTAVSKIVAYKCDCCFKYHTGRSKKAITEKERNKFAKSFKLKVVGKINI